VQFKKLYSRSIGVGERGSGSSQWSMIDFIKFKYTLARIHRCEGHRLL